MHNIEHVYPLTHARKISMSCYPSDLLPLPHNTWHYHSNLIYPIPRHSSLAVNHTSHTSHTSKCPFNYLPIFPYTHLFIQNMDKVRNNTDRNILYENETSSLRSWWQWRLINASCCGRALWQAATVLRSMFSSHLLPRLCLIVNSVATMLSCSAARRSSPNCDKADSWSWTKIPHQNCDLVWGIYTKHKRKCG